MKIQYTKICALQLKQDLQGKFVTLNAHVRKEEGSKIGYLSFHFNHQKEIK